MLCRVQLLHPLEDDFLDTAFADFQLFTMSLMMFVWIEFQSRFSIDIHPPLRRCFPSLVTFFLSRLGKRSLSTRVPPSCLLLVGGANETGPTSRLQNSIRKHGV